MFNENKVQDKTLHISNKLYGDMHKFWSYSP